MGNLSITPKPAGVKNLYYEFKMKLSMTKKQCEALSLTLTLTLTLHCTPLHATARHCTPLPLCLPASLPCLPSFSNSSTIFKFFQFYLTVPTNTVSDIRASSSSSLTNPNNNAIKIQVTLTLTLTLHIYNDIHVDYKPLYKVRLHPGHDTI